MRGADFARLLIRATKRQGTRQVAGVRPMTLTTPPEPDPLARRAQLRVSSDAVSRLRAPIASYLTSKVAVAEAKLARLFWEALDRVTYALTFARLSLFDVIHGPEAQTPADQKREADRERLREASPRALPEGGDRG